MDTAWLKSICSQSEARPSLEEPMTFVDNGVSYTIATDGRRIVQLEGNYGEYRSPTADMLPSLRTILGPTPPTAIQFSFTQLKAFVREQMKDVVRTCEECDNEGWITVFRRGEPFSKPCPKCDRAVIFEKRVYIGGTLFNVRLFEPFIENLPDTETARWYQEFRTAQALIDGGAWRFIVMPMREDQPHQDIARFEIERAQAAA